jgi:type I restriction enzyme R subunit
LLRKGVQHRPYAQNARVEMDNALWKVMVAPMKDDTELFKQFSDDESFRRGLMDAGFALTYLSP